MKLMADKLFYNCNVISMENRRIDFFAIKDGKIIKTGENDELNEWKVKSNEIIDLDKKTVLPGFIDSHMHLLSYGIKKEKQVDLKNVETIDELINKVKEFIEEKNIKPGEWIVGAGWNHEKFPYKKLPTRYDLDKASKEHPMFFYRTCYHICCVNSKALKVAKINEKTKIPEGGNIDTDKEGKPTGIIRENAIDLINERIPVIDDKEEIKKIIKKSCKDLSKVGITTVHTDDFSYVKDRKTLLKALKELESEGKLPVRMILQLRASNMDDLNFYKELKMQSWQGSDKLRYGPIKIIGDGSLGSRTAALNESYSDELDNKGILTIEPKKLSEIITNAFKKGFDIAVHAIGDRITDLILDIYKRNSTLISKKGLRPSIIHCQISSEDIINKFKENNIIANIQPIFLNTDWTMVEKRVGKKRAKYSYCWKKYLKRGVLCVGGSDAPIEPFNPIYGIYSAVIRKDLRGFPKGGWQSEEKLSVDDAIKLFTYNSAYLSKEENIKGSIKEGKYADFIVLSENIKEIAKDKIKDIKIIKTYVGGKRV
ncbi:MAG: amidohydrolase [Firmicutes bacterium]|nr:amidohydrolase [Bacillota bacterium]